MRTPQRSLSWLFAGIVAWAGFPVFDSLAQTYPYKPMRILVGFAPGGAVDFTARLVGQKMSESLGQPVVIENRAGAATAIATERVAKSPPDGYTLLLIPISTAVQSGLRKDLPYDLERDLAPVSLVLIGPLVLGVNSQVPARSVKELIALAQSQPGKLNYGSPGTGSANHLAGELFKLRAKVNIVHVPFKGSAASATAVAAGEVQVIVTSAVGALPHLESGRIRALAVTSARRVSSLPAIPTLDESGLRGFDYSAWYGLAAPSGVPRNVVMQLNAVVRKIVDMPDVKESFSKQGFEPEAGTPEQFAAVIRRELERTVELVKLTGLKVE